MRKSVLVSLVERLLVEFFERRRDGIGDGAAQRVGLEQLGNGGEESDHHDVEHHLLAEIFGQPRRGTTKDRGPGGNVADLHQFLLDDEDSARLQLRRELAVRLLRHDDQDVGMRDVGIEHRRIRQDHLRGAGAAARFRTEALGHGGEPAFKDAGGLAHHHRRQDHALSAESGDTDFRYWHGISSSQPISSQDSAPSPPDCAAYSSL